MNCPLCASPLSFGATGCPCGYNAVSSASDDSPIELSCWESLRAYWRVYWPTQVLAFAIVLIIVVLGVPRAIGATPLAGMAIPIVFGAGAFFLFVPRLFSRRYRGFSLLAIELATGTPMRKLRLPWRARVWLFLWWRQVLAGMFASLLAMPLNALLSIMGFQVAPAVATVAGVLVVGPILLKMLVGQQFDEFRVEARRTACNTQVMTASATPASGS